MFERLVREYRAFRKSGDPPKSLTLCKIVWTSNLSHKSAARPPFGRQAKLCPRESRSRKPETESSELRSKDNSRRAADVNHALCDRNARPHSRSSTQKTVEPSNRDLSL
jgi:hypothetical protein